MTRRARAVLLGACALLCAGAAAALASRYRSAAEAQYGELRPAVVARSALAADRAIGAREARRSLTVRRVPVRFVPADAIVNPQQAIGLRPSAPIPAGAYVLGAQLTAGSDRRSARPPAGDGRRAVEIMVTGGAALASGGTPAGRVDVIVTEQRGPGAGPRTYVAAPAVRLLDIRPPAAGSAGRWAATLALSRHQALELIEAESFARQIRILAGG